MERYKRINKELNIKSYIESLELLNKNGHELQSDYKKSAEKV